MEHKDIVYVDVQSPDFRYETDRAMRLGEAVIFVRNTANVVPDSPEVTPVTEQLTTLPIEATVPEQPMQIPEMVDISLRRTA